jgi:hypothetical protein
MARIDWDKHMASGRTPAEELEELHYSGIKDEQGARVLTVMLGRKVTTSAYTKKRQGMGLGRDRQGVPLVQKSSRPIFDDPPVVEGDALILMDCHVPFHDAAWINRVIDLALLWGVKKLILGGDILDLDALCSFAPFFKEKQIDLGEELEEAELFFGALACFKEVLWFAGGHERRFLRRLMSAIGMERLAKLVTDLEQLTASSYHHCFLISGGKKIAVVHPKNLSQIPARLPTFLCRKFRMPVVCGHDHIWGLAQDESGEDWACSVGVSANPKRLSYVTLETNTRPAVTQGALIVKDGHPWLLHPKFTDLKALRVIRWKRK